MLIGNPWIYLTEHSLHLGKEESDDKSSLITSFAVCEHHDSIVVATHDGLVTVYFSNNDMQPKTKTPFSSLVSNLLAPNGESYCTRLSWQEKSNNLLVAGRADGRIIYLDVLSTNNSEDPTKSNDVALIVENGEMHSGEIIDFVWNDNQSDTNAMNLLSVDGNGCCCLWMVEFHSGLIPIMKYHNDSHVNDVVMLDLMFPPNQQCNHFLFALENGNLYHANELGDCNQIKTNDCCEPIKVLHCNVEKSIILVITQSMQLIQLKVNNGVIEPTRTVKLSIELNFHNDTLLSPHGHLMCMTRKGTIQCFDLISDKNYELKVPLTEDDDNKVSPIIFAHSRDVLVVCSQDGKCTFWNFNDHDQKWIAVSSFTINQLGHNALSSCAFSKNSLLIMSEINATLLIEDFSLSATINDMFALQTGSSTVAIFSEENQGAFAILETGMRIHGITMDVGYICVWGENEIHVYKTDGYNHCESFTEISLKAQSVAINGDSLFIAKGLSLLVTDLSGVQRLMISLSPEEGQLFTLDTSCNQLALITYLGTVKTMDISKKEPKLLTTGSLDLQDVYGSHGRMISVKCNPDGTILSILSASSNSTHRLHFLNTENENVKEFEGVNGKDILIMSHYWDPSFPRLFVCEIRTMNGKCNHLLTLFVSEELNIYVHEDVIMGLTSRLMGVNAPSILLLTRDDSNKVSMSCDILNNRTIEGLEDSDTSNANSLSALVDFAYYLTAGDIEKAYFCILPIKRVTAWQKLAQICVLQERLDIAERCLLRLGNGIGVAAVRKTEKEVALAEVAIQLGMIDKAEMLYRKWNRFDLLCDLYRRQGMWKEAFDSSCQHDSTKEKELNIHHRKALEHSNQQDMLSYGNALSLVSKQAIVKQMILKNESVETFLRKENDVELWKSYAAYIESTGDLEKAKELYKMTNDILSLVRISCLEGDLNNAFNLVRENNSCVGAYHLARHLEANGDIEGAISCFARCGKYNYAIRLSKTYGINKEIVNFALQSKPSKTIECAQYLQTIGQNERAAELYIKAGEKNLALDLLVQLPFEKDTQLQADVFSIIKGLGTDVPDDIVNKCSIFLLRSGSHTSAFQLLQQKGRELDDIFNLYLQNNIILTETIIDEILSQYKASTNKSYLKKIASICKSQGNHVLACKKFTQGGDRSSAIKCLLLTGDTQNIISYAFTSRTKEVYIIAANYLQTLDYYHDEDIKKTMLQLYSRAKSDAHLMRLMCSWSSFEASNGEYEIAVKWLSEAVKYGEKTVDWDDSNNKEWIKRNINSINLFLRAQNIVSSDQSNTQNHILEIIQGHVTGDLVQIGDCYALLVLIESDCNRALILLEEMSDRGLSPKDYIEEEVIKSIYQATGNTWNSNDDSQESTEYKEDKNSD